MGYYADQYDADFEIGRDDVDRACALLDIEPGLDGLCREIEELGFEVCPDGKGGIGGVCFNGEKYLDCLEDTLSKLAPVVRDGSRIDFIGEDLSIWRLAFSGGVMEVESGTITFD